jgi:hypothetical protein
MSALDQRIEAALFDMTEPALLTEPDSPALRKRFEREARMVMDAFVHSGEITRFSVKVPPGPDLTFEITFQQPKRVQAIVIRCGPPIAGH